MKRPDRRRTDEERERLIAEKKLHRDGPKESCWCRFLRPTGKGPIEEDGE